MEEAKNEIAMAVSRRHNRQRQRQPLEPIGFERRVLLHSGPSKLTRIYGFIDDEETEALLKMAPPKFDRSTIVIDNRLVHSPIRTSSTAFLTDMGNRKTYAEPVERVISKLCSLVGCPRYRIETLMLVRYKPGEHYSDHHDYFLPEKHEAQLANGGQRVATVLIYLTDDPAVAATTATTAKKSTKRKPTTSKNVFLPEDHRVSSPQKEKEKEPEKKSLFSSGRESMAGGETVFPHLGVIEKPKKGDALYWMNVDKKSGEVLPETEHRGNVVKHGIKCALNCWIRSVGWPPL